MMIMTAAVMLMKVRQKTETLCNELHLSALHAQNQRLGRDGDQSDLTPTLQQLSFACILLQKHPYVRVTKIIGLTPILHLLSPSKRNYNWQSLSITLYCVMCTHVSYHSSYPN